MPRGIPWSVYMGERPVPGPGDVLFTADDRDLVAEWQHDREHRCRDCGTPLDLALNPNLAHLWDIDRVLCYPCEARERVADKAHRGPEPPYGVKFVPLLLDDDEDD